MQKAKKNDFTSLAFGGGVLHAGLIIQHWLSPTDGMVVCSIIIFLCRILAHVINIRLSLKSRRIGRLKDDRFFTSHGEGVV